MTIKPLCADPAPNKTNCKEVGKIACNKCFLVAPDWVLKNRTPAFAGDGPQQVSYGGGKYLWGNIPAIDVLQLEANEGEDYGEKLRLLFAASGDLRNVIKTIAQLTESYTQTVEVTMNDRDLDIVTRNAILLLIALAVEDFDASADCIIHVWYSTFLRKSDLDIL
ncbi:hypothetical protein QIS74_06273 [Colletotrichum tabaci]|uniref:DUF4470 domain-containing protein n=1 Tax=Colletotrichum tabaci TaxID=1209068 RepID=A0AAV9TFL7_9PEZI